MERVVLDNIPFDIKMPELLKRLRIDEDDDLAGEVAALVKEALKPAKPKGLYTTAYIDTKGENCITSGDVTFRSRVMRVNLDRVHKFHPFIVTAGTELDSWAAGFQDGLERYWADCIQESALKSASSYVRARIIEENGLSGAAAMNPGSLQDWPISEQTGLFTLLGNVKQAIGVELSESCLMLPVKTVSGILFAAESTYENCLLCPRQNCPGRRAPYDGSLFENKYKG